MKIWFSTGVTVSWENIGHLRSDLILTQGLVIKKKKRQGNSQVVQWLGLCTSAAGLQGTQV